MYLVGPENFKVSVVEIDCTKASMTESIRNIQSGNNPEEISVRQSDTALPRNFFSKFYFDLKMPKMVFK